MSATQKVDNSQAAKARRILKMWEDHEPNFLPVWLAMSAARDFCFKGAHYSSQARFELQRRNRIAPITDDTGDLVRYKASRIAATELYIDVQPEVPEELEAPMPEYDAALGDYRAPDMKPARDPKWAKFALEHDLFDPAVGYRRVRRRVALDGIGARAGSYVLDWDPAVGITGRIFARVLNPAGQVLWHSSYHHPHDPGNPWIIIRDFPQVEDAKALWPKAADKLKADSLIPAELRSNSEPLPGMPRTDGTITILRCYELYDSTKRYRLKQTHELEPLPKAAHYLACPQCGWQSGARGSMPGDWPKSAPCPECGADAGRVDISGKMVPTAAFMKGKRYTVIAPNCLDAGELDSRGWPGDPPTFPLFYFVPGVHPHEFAGMSDTERLSDVQCALDAGFRIGYEQMQRNRDYLFARLGVFVDAQNEPYQFDGSSDYVGYVRGGDPIQQSIQHFQGSGMPQALPAWIGMLNEKFRGTRGAQEVGTDPERLKGVRVAVLQSYFETGDVPLDDAIDSFRDQESLQFTNWHVMQCNLWTRAAWISVVGSDGEKGFQAMRGEDIPRSRMKASARPKVNASDVENSKQLIGILQQAAQLTDAAFEILLQSAELPGEWVSKLLKERQQAKQQQEAAAANAGGSGGAQPGPGTAPLPQGQSGIPAPAIAAGA